MNGTVSLYQCGCHKTGECWIVRHPKLPVPISYPTQVEANAALAELVKTSPGGSTT